MFNGNDKEGASLTVDDVMVGLDDCGRSVFGVMGELQPIVPELDFFLAWPVNICSVIS